MAVSARECGGCTACCTVMQVDALVKPRHTPCPHLSGNGCGIYRSRPAECQTFTCFWLIDGSLPDSVRPDRCGLMVWTKRSGFGQAFGSDETPFLTLAEEVTPGALDSYWGQKLVKALARRFLILGIRHGQSVLGAGDARHIFGPPHLVAEAKAFLEKNGVLEP